MLISVTKDDIRKGEQCLGDSCPIALAIQKMLKPGYIVKARSYELSIYQSNGTFIGGLPISRSAERFINKFDFEGKKAVVPFRFKANIDKYCRG